MYEHTESDKDKRVEYVDMSDSDGVVALAHEDIKELHLDTAQHIWPNTGVAPMLLSEAGNDPWPQRIGVWCVALVLPVSLMLSGVLGDAWHAPAVTTSRCALMIASR